MAQMPGSAGVLLEQSFQCPIIIEYVTSPQFSDNMANGAGSDSALYQHGS